MKHTHAQAQWTISLAGPRNEIRLPKCSAGLMVQQDKEGGEFLRRDIKKEYSEAQPVSRGLRHVRKRSLKYCNRSRVGEMWDNGPGPLFGCLIMDHAFHFLSFLLMNLAYRRCVLLSVGMFVIIFRISNAPTFYNWDPLWVDPDPEQSFFAVGIALLHYPAPSSQRLHVMRPTIMMSIFSWSSAELFLLSFFLIFREPRDWCLTSQPKRQVCTYSSHFLVWEFVSRSATKTLCPFGIALRIYLPVAL